MTEDDRRFKQIESLAAYGLRPFGCNADKSPQYRSGCAPWQPGWCAQHPSKVVSAPLLGVWPEGAGLVVVDVDSVSKEEGSAKLMWVVEALGIPVCALPTKGKSVGGWHVWYRRGAGMTPEMTTDRDWYTPDGSKGGQIRGSNGYAVSWDEQLLLDALDAGGGGEVGAVEWQAFLSHEGSLQAHGARGVASVGSYGAHPVLLKAIHLAVGAERPIDREACAAWLVRYGTNPRTHETALREVDRMVWGSARLWAKRARHEDNALPDGLAPALDFDAQWVAVALPEAASKVEAYLLRPADELMPTDSDMLARAFAATEAAEGHVKVVDTGQWYRWTGAGWLYDPSAAVLTHRLQAFGRERFHSRQWSRKKERFVVRPDPIKGGQQPLAKQAAGNLPAYEGMACLARDTQRCPHLLGLPRGKVFDLSQGVGRDAAPEDLVMKSCSVPPSPMSPVLLEVVEHLFGTQAALAQALFGSMLWGVPIGRIIAVLSGVTGSGKSTWLALLSDTLGPYAATLSSDVLTTRATSDIQFNVENANAQLRGVRLAVMSELPRKRALDPARINELTGGDVLVGRKAGTDQAASPASHSLCFAVNDLPKVDVQGSPETAQALWRRLRVFRLKAAMPEELGRKAQALRRDPTALGGLLQWLLDGAKTVRNQGLPGPDATMRDVLSQWWIRSHEG